MIRAVVRSGLLGQQLAQVEIPLEHAPTPRVLLAHLADRLPAGQHVGIALEGRLLEGDELDVQLRDGQVVIVAPTTGYGVGAAIVTVLIQLAVAAVVSYVAYLLSPRPKAPSIAQDRGDDSSSTYSWDGVKTNYGPGLPIPWGYGRHAVGGQVIWQDVEVTETPLGLDDTYRAILSLVDGQIHRIGDLPAVVADNVPTFPDHLRVNGNLVGSRPTSPGLRAWTRPGTQDQRALPAPFSGTSQVFSPQAQLQSYNEKFDYAVNVSGRITAISVLVTFPSGLYEQGPSGLLPTDIRIGVRYAPAGSTSFIGPLFVIQPTEPHLGFFAVSLDFELNGPPTWPEIDGPIVVRVERFMLSNPSLVNLMVVRDIVVRTPHTLRYPSEALLGFELKANEFFQGGRPNVSVRCDLSLVRVWDATNGWSPRCWDVPAAPFDFHAHPPGRNPAWCLLDFLLADYGLGRWLTEDDIDLQAFREWAIYCDQDPDPAEPWGEPQFTVDIVGDRPRPAWEWVLAFCAAGRAAPVMRNGRISVVYQYRDAHTDGTVSVPAKTPVQLITSGLCEDVEVTWLSKNNRPTVYQFQFLNEEDAYAQDVLPVEDDEGTLNDPTAIDKDQYRSEDVQAYGVTRASQLFREGVWRHRIQRLVRREITFVAGPWTLAAEVGDVIEFEHELLRPFGADVPIAMQVVGGGLATTTIVVDHHLSGTGLECIWRTSDGTAQKAAVSSYLNTTQDGRNVSVVTFGAPVDCEIGSACAIGLVDKLVEQYEVVSITLQQDMKRRVRALQWTPEAYDPISREAFENGTLDEAAPDPVIDEPNDDPLPGDSLGVRLVGLPDASHLLAWGAARGLRTRVYVREAGVPTWMLVDETLRNEVRMRGLQVGRDYEVAICPENRSGRPVPPDLGEIATVRPEEFPRWQLPRVTNARATVLELGVLLQWDDLGQRSLRYYEVRIGSTWSAAKVVARTQTPQVLLSNPPGGAPFLIAARADSGLYGPAVVVAEPTWQPTGTAELLVVDDFATTPAGTHSGTAWNATDGCIELSGDNLTGTYTSAEQDLGSDQTAYWRVRVDRQELEDVTIGDLDFELGSGEARWRTLAGRPASPAAPGVDWQTLISDLDVPIGDLPADFLIGGHVGEAGAHSQILLETRFYSAGAWGAWREHLDRVVTARRMQARLTFNRRTSGYRARLLTLQFEAYA